MRAVIEIIFAIIFTAVTGTAVVNLSSKAIKKEALTKVQKGLPSLEDFTRKITQPSGQ